MSVSETETECGSHVLVLNESLDVLSCMFHDVGSVVAHDSNKFSKVSLCCTEGTHRLEGGGGGEMEVGREREERRR